MKSHSQKFLQQRRFYMVLPLLILPFITMIFWALGGGQVTAAHAQVVRSGLNTELPGAHFGKGDDVWDKFALYEEAKRDSIRYEEARKNDPYYVVSTLKGSHPSDTLPEEASKLNTSLGSKNKYSQIDKDEKLINQKLEQLTRQLREPDQGEAGAKIKYAPQAPSKANDPQMANDVERLEKMMEIMAGGDASDPEMKQIEGVLDKVLDIQHPERAQEKLRAQSLEHKQLVYPVESARQDDNISLVENPGKGIIQKSATDSSEVSGTVYVTTERRNSFYGLNDEEGNEDQNSNAIEAVVHETQSVVAGSTVKMRLLSDVFINGELIAKDHFVYGVCAISGERLTISINSIREEHSLFPVSLKVFDLDGLEGIYIPGAITRDAAKQATSQSVQDMQLYSMDNSLGVQAATTGLEAAKGLFSKKAKLVKVTIKAGYQVLLKDGNQLNQ